MYTKGGERLARFSGQAYCIGWSPDGRRIAVGDKQGEVRVFDGRSFDELLRFRAHDNYVFSLAWSPDGSRLITASGDATVRVWDARPRGEQEADRRAYEESFEALLEHDPTDLTIRFEVAGSTVERGIILRAALEGRLSKE